MKTVVAAALGECVHVAGVMNFLRLAEFTGWRTIFLGPAVPVERVLEAARAEQAELVAVSYRLTPDNGERLLGDFAEAFDELRSAGVRFVFGGTPPVAERARALGFFERVFDGSDPVEDIIAYLRGQAAAPAGEGDYPQTFLERLRWKAPWPLIRHHFGLPTVQATAEGITEIARARVLDVISLGTDQDAQEHFFHPERQDARRTGAGGVPVRSAEDYRLLYAHSRTGNYPLMRAYSGTDDLLKLAALHLETIHNAWCAVPVYWFNAMDGRGPMALEDSIRAHIELMRWHGERAVPVEVNEPHHWGMRDASDVTYVVSAYLSAHIAKACGVKDYIAQLMFDCPPGVSEACDLAKMLAVLDIIQPLEDELFHIYRQTRTGLLSYPLDPDYARGHLAASVYAQMALKPHIVHVVSHSEAHHAAEPGDVIEACKLARQAVANALDGQPDMTRDPLVAERRAELVQQARVTLAAIARLASASAPDPLCDPAALALAVTTGILDAPHLLNNRFARGRAVTRIDARGACVAVDPATGRPLCEEERVLQPGIGPL